MAHYGQNVRHFSVGGLVTSSFAEEMAAYEALGPACQRVIDEGPVKVAATKILASILAIKDKDGNVADPKKDVIDQAIAKGMMMKAAQIIMCDRTEQDAIDGIRVMVPKRTRRAYR